MVNSETRKRRYSAISRLEIGNVDCWTFLKGVTADVWHQKLSLGAECVPDRYWDNGQRFLLCFLLE